MREVGEGGGEAGALRGREGVGVPLEAREAGGLDALDDLATGVGDPDALHAAVVGVLATAA